MAPARYLGKIAGKTQNREFFSRGVPRFETFEIAAAAICYIVYELKISFCCEVAIQKVLIDTSASQTIPFAEGSTASEAAAAAFWAG